MQAALQKNPGMFQIIGDPPFCAGSLEALSTLKASQPELVPGQTKIRSMATDQSLSVPMHPRLGQSRNASQNQHWIGIDRSKMWESEIVDEAMERT
ncbi:hypothetical protein J2W56_006800 [Nocardia kruczakiae]|uniref:Uncharacterized protein n=1 Tax=Nocardia kruczakiae TaxID=261477 RepID=A0ABU1XR61_9NOCA|nr:hypothetical protein [Nocardia kruczakiae]MDR7173034.1 hypothetical protein [Nocardia kruczakiae]